MRAQYINNQIIATLRNICYKFEVVVDSLSEDEAIELAHLFQDIDINGINKIIDRKHAQHIQAHHEPLSIYELVEKARQS